jgi:hypothetical protein
MGCKYACTCGGRCWSCSQYEPESYFGEAEDILAQTKGFASDDEWRAHQRKEREEEEEYNRQMAAYYENLEQQLEARHSMKTELTVEESEELIKLGIAPDLASKQAAVTISQQEYNEPRKPIFTLSDIVFLIPKELNGYILSMLATKLNIELENCENGWSACYVDSSMHTGFGNDAVFTDYELIDALRKLLVWIIKQNHYKPQ